MYNPAGLIERAKLFRERGYSFEEIESLFMSEHEIDIKRILQGVKRREERKRPKAMK